MLDYPTLERAVETLRDRAEHRDLDEAFRSGTALPAMAMQVYAERDLTRQGVSLHVRATHHNDPYGGMAVIERVTWRALREGEDVPATPFWLAEPQARILAEQLGEFHPDMRRLARTREQLDQSQNELRSLSNQLEEVRNHNATLVRTNQEQQRQVRWLERELRDAHQERRAAE